MAHIVTCMLDFDGEKSSTRSHIEISISPAESTESVGQPSPTLDERISYSPSSQYSAGIDKLSRREETTRLEDGPTRTPEVSAFPQGQAAGSACCCEAA